MRYASALSKHLTTFLSPDCPRVHSALSSMFINPNYRREFTVVADTLIAIHSRRDPRGPSR